MICIINGEEREVQINNVPSDVKHWVVAKVDTRDMQLWYMKSYEFNEYTKAKHIAEKINGVVLENKGGK